MPPDTSTRTHEAQLLHVDGGVLDDGGGGVELDAGGVELLGGVSLDGGSDPGSSEPDGPLAGGSLSLADAGGSLSGGYGPLGGSV